MNPIPGLQQLQGVEPRSGLKVEYRGEYDFIGSGVTREKARDDYCRQVLDANPGTGLFRIGDKITLANNVVYQDGYQDMPLGREP